MGRRLHRSKDNPKDVSGFDRVILKGVGSITNGNDLPTELQSEEVRILLFGKRECRFLKEIDLEEHFGVELGPEDDHEDHEDLEEKEKQDSKAEPSAGDSFAFRKGSKWENRGTGAFGRTSEEIPRRTSAQSFEEGRENVFRWKDLVL